MKSHAKKLGALKFYKQIISNMNAVNGGQANYSLPCANLQYSLPCGGVGYSLPCKNVGYSLPC